MTIHLWRARNQPATRFRIDLSTIKDGVVTSRFHTVTHPKHRVFRCFKCRKKHYAKNMIAHAYYEGTYYFCAPGKGCKAR